MSLPRILSRPHKHALSLLIAGLPLILLTHCGEWVSLGPFIECGRSCALPQGALCHLGRGEYNRFGECVCADIEDCPGYVCNAEEPTCFIAQYDQNGHCLCSVWIEPGACGQPCTPSDEAMIQGCPGDHFEYDGIGRCACGSAICPCGQPCRIRDDQQSECHVLRQYDENGICKCPPVRCKNHCSDNPCCAQMCGSICSVPDCDPKTGDCSGQCNSKNQCVAMATDCEEPPK